MVQVSERKRRRDMTEYEKAIDWRDRLSPRWWRAVFIALGAAVVLYAVGTVLRALSI